jgi:hypothetical protein
MTRTINGLCRWCVDRARGILVRLHGHSNMYRRVTRATTTKKQQGERPAIFKWKAKNDELFKFIFNNQLLGLTRALTHKHTYQHICAWRQPLHYTMITDMFLKKCNTMTNRVYALISYTEEYAHDSN